MINRIISFLYTLTIVAFLPTLTYAYEFSLGENVFLELKGDVTYSLKYRMEDPHPLLENETYGNSNFDKGDLVNNKGMMRTEITLDTASVTFFGNLEAFYDEVYTHDNKYPPDTDISKAKEHAAYRIDSPEYYLDFHSERLTLRVGKQVVEWGELIAAVFAPGVDVMNFYDGTKVSSAGYTIRDYKVPATMGWLSYEVTGNLSVEAIYSQDFEPRKAFPTVGTYSAFLDMLGYGGPTMGMDIQRPKEASDMQQYGAAARMVFPTLGSFEMGFYYAHYLDYGPYMDISKMAMTYEYMDMYGLSFSHAFWDLQFCGELSYRPDQPTQLVNDFGPVAGVERVEGLNWGISGSMMLSDFFESTPWTITFSPLIQVIGGYNLDYEKDKNFLKPEDTAYYMANFTFESSDMVDNTKLSLTISFQGALHEELKCFHSVATTLTARIGDNIGIMLGYDLKLGDEEMDAEMATGYVPDRDALSLNFIWYFI